MSGLYPKAGDEDDGAIPAKSVVKSEQTGSPSAPKYVDEPGPTEKRKCKDVFFLILFLLFWIGMFVIAGLAVKEGNLDRLKYGNDTEGNLCGVKNSKRDLTAMPYQYIFNPTDFKSTRKCISACPTVLGDIICSYDTPVPTYPENITLAEKYGRLKMDGLVDNCTITLETRKVLNRCIPDPAQFRDLFQALNITQGEKLYGEYMDKKELASQIFSDIYDSWRTILICSVISLVLSFLWLFIVQYFAKFMVWLTLVFVNVVGLAFMAFMWYNYYAVHKGNDTFVSKYVPTGDYNEKVILAISVIVSIVALFVLFLTLGLRKRIGLAVGLIQEASKAIRAMPLIVFFPIFKYVLLTLVTAWTIYIWSLLATSGSVQQKLASNASDKLDYNFEPNRVFQMLTIYYALGFFWTFNWIIAISQSTIAGAIAGWYWTRDKKSIPMFPVFSSFRRTLRFHLGSLAFGSLVLAIVQTIQLIITYMETQLKKSKESKWVKYLLTCLNCCFLCVERMLKFLNKNAYIEIAIYGYDFCEGSKAAFQLLVRNALRLTVVDKIGDFLFFLGKLMITMATCLIGAFLLQPKDANDNSRFWAIPLILIAISSYVISSCFMAVFDMAINTLFLCFCEDSERNDGQSKPYYMPDSLKKFMDDSNKVAPKL